MVQGIKNDVDGQSIAYADVTTISAADLMAIEPEFGSTVVQLFKCGTAEISTYYAVYNSLSYTRFDGSNGSTYTLSISPTLYIAAYTTGTDPTSNTYMTVLWLLCDDVNDAISIITNNTWSSDNLLFRGTQSQAEAAGAIVNIEEWDDSPEMEDSTDDNIGGEFADLMPFDVTDIQDISAASLLADLGWGTQDGLDPYSSSGNSFFTPYVLSPAQFAQLGYCMFSSSMWNTISQWFNGPEDVMNGILRVLDFPCYPTAGAGATIAVCGQDIYYEASPGGARTYASGNHLGSRYKDHNLGSISLKEVWGTARDYTDSKVWVFLPFIGLKELDAAQCVGHVLTLLLRIDFWTGDIIYLLNADNASIGGKWFRSAAYIGRWTGNCASELPIGRVDNTKSLTSLLGGIGAAAGGIAMSALATTPVGAFAGLAGAVGGAATAGGHIGGLISGGIPRSANMQGNLTGNSGVLDILYPYIIVQRAVPDYPTGWRSQIGAPRHQYYSANDLSGYTLFEEIKLVNMEGASGEEIDELTRELCTEGIIL